MEKPSNTLHPMQLATINKGQLIAQIDRDLSELQGSMLRFVDEYGQEAAKAKGTLTIKLSVIAVDPQNGVYGFKSETGLSLPKRPADVAVAFAREEDGEESIVVRPFVTRTEAGPRLPFGEHDAQAHPAREHVAGGGE